MSTPTMPDATAWQGNTDTAVYRLARDFATEAYSNSKEINAQFEELDGLRQQVAALPGGERLARDIDALVTTLVADVSNLAAMVGVKTVRHFALDILTTLFGRDDSPV